MSTLGLAAALISTGCDTPENDVTAPKIVAGAAHACAFDADREQVVCWGDNSYGQLGNEEFSAEGVSAPVRVKVISGRKIKSLSAGYSHTCALVSGGDDDSKNTVACWGYNHYGQVGNGTFKDSNVPAFVNGPDGNRLTGVVTLSAGAYHTCASIVKGSASDPSNYIATTYCWGRNDRGQIGNGALTNVNVPTEIKGLDYSSGVAAGTAHTCALTSKSTDDAQAKKYVVMCWGDASRGQMRDAKVEGGYTATPVDIGLPLQGDDDGFPALFSEHVVQADVTTATGKPVKGEAALAAAPETPAYGQTCVLSADQVQCWGGSNQNGQWGTDKKDVTEFGVKTAEIVDGSSLKAYGAGNAQSCMLVGKGDDSSANEVACWGFSSSLGFELPADATDAVVASNRQTVTLSGQRPTGIAVGREFVCYAAKGEQPQIWCWGIGKKGQIGNGSVASTRVPVCVKGYCPETKASENLVDGQPFAEAPGATPGFLQISANGSNTCGVVSGGQVYCWGETKSDSEEEFHHYIHSVGAMPRVEPLLEPVTAVSIWEEQRCAILIDGSVKCWGDFAVDCMIVCYGTNEYRDDLAPFDLVPLPSAAREVIVGPQSTCVVGTDSSMRCGQTRDFDGTNYPRYNISERDVKQAAMLIDGLMCWFYNGKTETVCDGLNVFGWNGSSFGLTMEEPIASVHALFGVDVCVVSVKGKLKCARKVEGTEGFPAVKAVSGGYDFLCALTTAGGVKCVGKGGSGQLGNGKFADSNVPVDVQGLQFGVLSIQSGDSHTCALLIGGIVKCWGSNNYNQLGVADVRDSAVPVIVDLGGSRGIIDVQGVGLVEGEPQQKVTVTIPEMLGDLKYAFDCDSDGAYEINGKVAGHDCFFDKLNSGAYQIGYKITRKNPLGEFDETGPAAFVVQNLPPVVTAVNHDAAVLAAGSNAAKTFTISSVTASDPGGDALTYGYDCNRDGLISDTEKQGPTNAACDLSALTPGTYSLGVFVTDADHEAQGNGQTIKPITITIVPPLDTTIATKPPAYSGANVTFTFSSPQTSTIETKLDGAAFAVTTAGSRFFAALTDGTHFFYARAVSGGNADASPAAVTWVVDTVGPVTVADTSFAQPLGVASVQINFHATDANAAAGFTYQCSLDGGSASSCASGDTFGPVAGEGAHSVVVTAYDAALNPATTAATVTWSYYIPPVTTLDASGPTQGSTISSDAASFTFSSPTATSFECSLDGGAWTTCTSPADYTGLPDGSHSFAVRPVRNGVPGTPSATRTWTVDTTPPQTTISASYANDASGASYTVEFGCSDGACFYDCRLDGGSYVTCSSPYTRSVTTAGQHTIDVRAYDAVGNVDATPATATWNATVTGGGGGGGGSLAVTAATLATGGMHSCAVANGKMYCWGTNGSGQLGNVTGLNTAPSQMGGSSDWASVSAGPFHTCGIRASGALYCWGQSSSGQLGDPGSYAAGSTASPVAVAAGQNWLKVGAIDNHTCAIRDDHSLWCWGDNSLGQLGTGSVDYNPVTAPVQVGIAVDWVDVAGGFGFTCARNASREVYCWGNNNMGQLGTGTVDAFASPLTAAATGVATLTAGGSFVCAVKTDGTLWCWGDNASSQGTGDGMATPYRTSETQVGTDIDWASVEAGVTHVCAIKTGRTLWCWGDQGNNALGDDASSGTQMTPLQIGADTDWLEVSCAQNFCMGMHDTVGKDVFSWGDNMFSQCGTDGMVTPVVSPMLQLTPFP